MYNNSGNEYAYVGMNLSISSANIDATGLMLCQRVKYTAQDGRAVISTANTNLNGTGAISTLISGSGNGTIVKRIIIKAQGSTTQGIIRIFHCDGNNTRLMSETPTRSTTQSPQDETLIAVIDDYFYLENGHSLKVSTEKAETFILTAEGMNMSYPS